LCLTFRFVCKLFQEIGNEHQEKEMIGKRWKYADWNFFFSPLLSLRSNLTRW